MSFLRSMLGRSESDSTLSKKKDRQTNHASASAPVTPHEHHKKPAYDSDMYDSLEHFEFCTKWKVCGEMNDYPFWKTFIDQIEPELNKGNYQRLVFDVKDHFGQATRSNLLSINRPTGTAPAVSISKEERRIWTCTNFKALLVDIEIHEGLSKFNELFDQFISPVMLAIDKLHFMHNDFHKQEFVKPEDQKAIREELRLAFSKKYAEKKEANNTSRLGK